VADRRVRIILEAHIAQAQSALRQLQGDVGRTAQGIERQNEGLGKTSGVIAGRVIPAVAGMAAGWQAYDKVLKAGFDRLMSLEDAEKRMTQMGLSTAEVERLMAGLTETVTGTAFTLDDGATVMAKFVSSGMDLGEVNDRLTMTADTAAFAQAPLSEIGNIFERIQSEGRLTGETLNMLQVRGVPALELLSSAAGVSAEAMRGMISQGAIDADAFFGLWETGSQGFGENAIKIAGSAQSMGDTVRGALANAQTAAARLGATLLDDFMPAIRSVADGFKAAADGVIGFLDATQPVRDFFGDTIGQLIEWDREILEFLGIMEDEGPAKTFQSAMSGAKSETEAFTMEVVEAADELAVLSEAFTAYQDALKASTDPVLNLINAVDKVSAAQATYNEAVSTYGTNSSEARSAAIDLFEATVGLESAANNADLSFAGVNEVLADMVSQGALTAEQAGIVAEAIGGAQAAAEDYTGPYVADLQAEIDDPAIRDAKRQLDMVARTRNPKYLAELDRQAEIRARNKLDAAAAPRRAPITPYLTTGSLTVRVNYAISGGIPAGLTRGHSGGLVTTTGIRRMHDGGPVRRFHGGSDRLAGDEVRAILQTGERVLSRSQTAVFDRLMSMMGRTAMAGLSFHGGGVADGNSSVTDATTVGRMVAKEVGQAINGATLVIDDRGRGYLVARNADLYGRGG
jgi:tape measure domain-containing protein